MGVGSRYFAGFFCSLEWTLSHFNLLKTICMLIYITYSDLLMFLYIKKDDRYKHYLWKSLLFHRPHVSKFIRNEKVEHINLDMDD